MSASPPGLSNSPHDQNISPGVRFAGEAFIQAFEQLQLAPASFDHQAHLRYAWLITRQAPLLAAATRVSRGIYRFASYHGVPQKYHHSLTLACVALIAQRASATQFEQFLEQNPDLINIRQALAQYYHPQTLASEEARGSWCAPDRQPLGDSAILAQVPHPGAAINALPNSS